MRIFMQIKMLFNTKESASDLFFPKSLTICLFRSIAEKGPTTEEKVLAIEASLATYEAKISGLGRASSNLTIFY